MLSYAGGEEKKIVLIDVVRTCACQSWWWERLGKTQIGNRFVCVFRRQVNAYHFSISPR